MKEYIHIGEKYFVVIMVKFIKDNGMNFFTFWNVVIGEGQKINSRFGLQGGCTCFCQKKKL